MISSGYDFELVLIIIFPKLDCTQYIIYAVQVMIVKSVITPTSLALNGIESAPAPIALWNSTREPVRKDEEFVVPKTREKKLSLVFEGVTSRWCRLLSGDVL